MYVYIRWVHLGRQGWWYVDYKDDSTFHSESLEPIAAAA
jgi:hypothetical protein